MSGSVSEVYYRRNIPGEWNGLLETARFHIGPEDRPEAVTIEAAAGMYESARDLDNKALETNRYYGLGIVMCEFARALQEPYVRDMVTTQAATNLVYEYDSRASYRAGTIHGIRPENIVSAPMSDAFKLLTKQVSDALPRDTRLVADTLQAVTSDRQIDVRPSILDGVRPTPGRLEWIANGTGATEHIATNATAATRMLIVRALEAQLESQPLADRIVTADMLEKLDLTKLAVNSALLRLDEFGDEGFVHGLVDTDKEGQLTFQRDRLPKDPPIITQRMSFLMNPLLHRERLGCPAIHVQRLVPLMLDIVPEIILKAQQTIRTPGYEPYRRKSVL